jgi:hypothetical protein
MHNSTAGAEDALGWWTGFFFKELIAWGFGVFVTTCQSRTTLFA